MGDGQRKAVGSAEGYHLGRKVIGPKLELWLACVNNITKVWWGSMSGWGGICVYRSICVMKWIRKEETKWTGGVVGEVAVL